MAEEFASFFVQHFEATALSSLRTLAEDEAFAKSDLDEYRAAAQNAAQEHLDAINQNFDFKGADGCGDGGLDCKLTFSSKDKRTIVLKRGDEETKVLSINDDGGLDTSAGALIDDKDGSINRVAVNVVGSAFGFTKLETDVLADKLQEYGINDAMVMLKSLKNSHDLGGVLDNEVKNVFQKAGEDMTGTSPNDKLKSFFQSQTGKNVVSTVTKQVEQSTIQKLSSLFKDPDRPGKYIKADSLNEFAGKMFANLNSLANDEETLANLASSISNLAKNNDDKSWISGILTKSGKEGVRLPATQADLEALLRSNLFKEPLKSDNSIIKNITTKDEKNFYQFNPEVMGYPFNLSDEFSYSQADLDAMHDGRGQLNKPEDVDTLRKLEAQKAKNANYEKRLRELEANKDVPERKAKFEDSWWWFFGKLALAIYLIWNSYDDAKSALNDALQSVNGCWLYQYEEQPSMEDYKYKTSTTSFSNWPSAGSTNGRIQWKCKVMPLSCFDRNPASLPSENGFLEFTPCKICGTAGVRHGGSLYNWKDLKAEGDDPSTIPVLKYYALVQKTIKTNDNTSVELGTAQLTSLTDLVDCQSALNVMPFFNHIPSTVVKVSNADYITKTPRPTYVHKTKGTNGWKTVPFPPNGLAPDDKCIKGTRDSKFGSACEYTATTFDSFITPPNGQTADYSPTSTNFGLSNDVTNPPMSEAQVLDELFGPKKPGNTRDVYTSQAAFSIRAAQEAVQRHNSWVSNNGQGQNGGLGFCNGNPKAGQYFNDNVNIDGEWQDQDRKKWCANVCSEDNFMNRKTFPGLKPNQRLKCVHFDITGYLNELCGNCMSPNGDSPGGGLVHSVWHFLIMIGSILLAIKILLSCASDLFESL